MEKLQKLKKGTKCCHVIGLLKWDLPISYKNSNKITYAFSKTLNYKIKDVVVLTGDFNFGITQYTTRV